MLVPITTRYIKLIVDQRRTKQTWLKGVLFPTGTSSPREVLVRVRASRRNHGPPFWSSDLEFTQWFPRGFKSAVIEADSENSRVHTRTYEVWYSSDSTCSLPNQCLAASHDIFWLGNVIVFKRGVRDPRAVVNVRRGEAKLISVLTGM